MYARRPRTHLISHAVLSLGLALVAQSAYAQTPATSLESLLDPDAKIVARLDVARLRAAPTYRQIEGVLVETLGDAGVEDAHARAVLARVDECVISARVEDLDAEQVLLIARGRFTLDDSTRLLSSRGVTIETRGNHRVMRRGVKAAVFVGTDRFVFGRAELVLAALDRIDGRSPRAPVVHRVVARLLAEPTRASHVLSVVGVIEGELRTQLASELGAMPVARATAFVVEADLTAQLALSVIFEMPDAATATQAQTTLAAMLAEAARLPIVRTMGLTSVVRALRVRATDVRVAVTGRFRDADVRRLVAMAAAELGPTPPPATPRAR